MLAGREELAGPESPVKIGDGARFGVRLVEGFFRHWLWYVLLVVVFTGFGVLISGRLSAEYESEALLSASSNPLVDQTEIRGAGIMVYESPATGTARIVDEQLESSQFIAQLAERIGLSGALARGELEEETLRRQITTTVEGVNVFGISAVWDHPAVAQSLVQTTLDLVLENLVETVSADSAAAIEFYETLEATAGQRVAAAQSELDAYVSTLSPVPEGQQRNIDEQLMIQRLDGALTRAEEELQEARSGIETAQFAMLQAQSEVGQVLSVIDPPELPTSPESAWQRIAILIASFFLLGVLVATAALALTVTLDQTIRSIDQVPVAGFVVAVPTVKAWRTRGLLARALRRRRPDERPALPISTS